MIPPGPLMPPWKPRLQEDCQVRTPNGKVVGYLENIPGAGWGNLPDELYISPDGIKILGKLTAGELRGFIADQLEMEREMSRLTRRDA